MSISERIGIAANAATIVLVALLSIIIVKENLVPIRTRAAVRATSLQVGTELNSKKLHVDWALSNRTIVLAMQTTCHYCTDSAPFFRKLSAAAHGKVRTVAILPQPIGTSKTYLDGLGVKVDEIRQFPLSDIGVHGTPTLVLVNDRGAIQNVWVGELTPDEERQVLSVVNGNYQDQPNVELRTVGLERYTIDDPVRIIQVLEGGVEITPERPAKEKNGKPFAAGPDWLRVLTVVVKNFSPKNVVAAHLLVDFPETGTGVPGDPTVAVPIWLGNIPEHGLYNTRDGKKLELPTKPALNLVAGAELKISMAPYYEKVKASIESKRPGSDITTCWIRLQQFYFADGTRWAPGNFQKPDPASPGKYEKITADEFRNITPAE